MEIIRQDGAGKLKNVHFACSEDFLGTKFKKSAYLTKLTMRTSINPRTAAGSAASLITLLFVDQLPAWEDGKLGGTVQPGVNHFDAGLFEHAS